MLATSITCNYLQIRFPLHIDLLHIFNYHLLVIKTEWEITRINIWRAVYDKRHNKQSTISKLGILNTTKSRSREISGMFWPLHLHCRYDRGSRCPYWVKQLPFVKKLEKDRWFVLLLMRSGNISCESLLNIHVIS